MQFPAQTLKSQWPSILAFIVVVICLLPIFETSLYSDDLQTFESRNGCAEYQGKSFIEWANPEIAEWKEHGRFTPGVMYIQEFSFKYFTSVCSYKSFIFIMNLIAVVCFISLLSVIGFGQLIPLFLLFYAGGIQFRIEYNDAYTSFSGMYQTLSICMSLCLFFFVLYDKTKSFLLLVCSVILFVCSFLISEIGLSLIVFLFLCSKISGQSWKKCIALLLPFLFIAILYVLYVIEIRTHVKQFYTGVATNFEVYPMLNVLEFQLFAAVPFSNLLGKYALIKKLFQQLDTWFNLISILIIILLFLFIMLNLTQSKISKQKNTWLWLIALAFSLLVIPVIFIMPSAKYQIQLGWGNGYLPVYIQNYGMALVLALVTYLSVSSINKWAKPTVVIILSIALLSAISAFLFNSDSIKLKNYCSSFVPEALYDDIKGGILSDCAAGSSIILNKDIFWNSASFYSSVSEKFTGKKFIFSLVKDWKPNTNESSSKPCFLLSCERGDTIFVNLYRLNCNTGEKISLVKCYPNYHNIRLSESDKHTLTPMQ